ncbi:MAG TPA: PPC domain-containing protein [Bryobacteraceae bacterium]|nr:PPC domain-containing protein [Bryobacteraceae bacterium]
MKRFLPLALGAALSAAPPVINELQPRGAQKGRPFTLTIAGQNLGEGAVLLSSLPATFTPLTPANGMSPGKYASFLVEPKGDLEVGVYPVRVQSADGLSNILLFSVGAFPEVSEEESQPGGLPHSNDSIEKAQSLPSTAITLNGSLRGPERDVYRLQVKAGERRVFEIDARRAGSAVDPVIRVLDSNGKQIARSEDAPMLQLDPRVEVTFPAAGYYYVEIHDARFSSQAQNFYRLKTGAYTYPTEVFPLGGQRGKQVEISLGPSRVKADLSKAHGAQTTVNLPDSPALPLPLAVGEYPEISEPVSAPLSLPVTVNARISKPAEIDSYKLAVQPGDEYIFELQARELGTSKLMGVLSILDGAGKRLASAGDTAFAVDLFAVQASSRTAGDPFLNFKVPEGVREITVTVEDLARRGGTHYAYRLHASRAAEDMQAMIVTPMLNIPAGGTALVNLSVDRRGYAGPLTIKALNLPKGLRFSGGTIPPDPPESLTPRLGARRALVSLTADENIALDTADLAFAAVGTDAAGQPIERRARGIGYTIGVNGATAQGVVDRQRPLTGAWLGRELPVAMAPAAPAHLALQLEKTDKKESGYEFLFRWTWKPRNAMQAVPPNVSVDVPNFADLRIIGMTVDAKDKNTGTFLVTSTRNTLPARYDIGITGRLMADGLQQEIYSEVQQFTLPALDPEEKNANASPTAAR